MVSLQISSYGWMLSNRIKVWPPQLVMPCVKPALSYCSFLPLLSCLMLSRDHCGSYVNTSSLFPGRVDAINSCPTTILRSLTTRKAAHRPNPSQPWRPLNCHFRGRTLSLRHCRLTSFTNHLSFHIRRILNRFRRLSIEMCNTDTKDTLRSRSLLIDSEFSFLL